MRFLLTIQYLGTRYAGWQSQANAVGVQQVIEAILEKSFGEKIVLYSAGRTDSGVHARGQRAHVDIPSVITPRGLALGLNDRLPPDIRISEALQVPADFHARFDAKRKTYVYRIWNHSVDDVFLAQTHANVRTRLDLEAMQEAIAPIVGTHDFKAFTVRAPEVSSTVRTVHSASIVSDGRGRFELSITADGFLRFMVRRIAGGMIEVGRRKLGRDGLKRSLDPTYAEARWTAPAHGLTLDSVEYDLETPESRAQSGPDSVPRPQC